MDKIKRDKIILFDMDGTLIDSTSAIYESFCVVFEKHKMPLLGRAEVAQYIGYPLDKMFAFFGAPSGAIAQLCADYREHYIKICDKQTKMLEGAVNAIESASKFASLGIVTTKTSDSTRNILSHFGVVGHFEVIIGKDSVTHPKPHKEPILKALEAFKGAGVSAESSMGAESSVGVSAVESHKIFMIGDTILDLISARDAGIVGLGVLCGYGTREDLEKYSKFVFKDTKEAVEFARFV